MGYFWRRRTKGAGVPVRAAVILFAFITAMFAVANDIADYVGTTVSAEDRIAAAEEHAGETIYEVMADDMVNHGAIKETVFGNTVLRIGSKK